MENLDDISLAFASRRNRALIVLKRQMDIIGKTQILIALINRHTKNPEFDRLSHELSENMIDIAEIMDGFKDDVTRILQHTIDESDEMLKKLKEVEEEYRK